MLKSFYTIEMYIQPGGGRYALVFVANSLLEIQELLRLQLSNKMAETILTVANKSLMEMSILPFLKRRSPE